MGKKGLKRWKLWGYLRDIGEFRW